ncbi:histidine kinase [Enterococcus florum]|uniref:Histidine kinase n=1 Tax=Enterococcus florum TaxID=2480627 RepID=A0A4V0WQ04_9ENTE|nr:GHKL domain-containing protein [Enterococcus florum]GCF95669.1 histidine kinase [Enterococcus florum]
MTPDRILEIFLFNALTFLFTKWFSLELFSLFVDRKVTRKKKISCLACYLLFVVFPISLVTEIGADGLTTARSNLLMGMIIILGELFFYLYLNKGLSFRGVSGYFIVETLVLCFSQISLLFVFKTMEQFNLGYPWPQVLTYYICMPIGYFLFIKLLYSLELRTLIDSLFETRKRAILSTVGFFFLAQINLVFEFFAPEFTEEFPYGHTLLIFSLFCALIVFASFYKTAQIRLAEKEATLLQQENYVQNLETIQREMRTLQHDYKNILSGLYLQSEEGNTEEIKHYLNQTLGQLDENVAKKLKDTTHLSNIRISPVKSMLLTKLSAMEQQGIRFNLEVSDPIEEINMELNDFVRCLGILLDNAMEEVQQIHDGTAKLDLILSNEAEDLTIIVKNPTREKPKIHKIWQEGFSTKGENRGLGLFSYQRIIQKYGHISKKTFVQEHEFVQMLTIKN